MKWVQALLNAAPPDFHQELSPAKVGEKFLGPGSAGLRRALEAAYWHRKQLEATAKRHQGQHDGGEGHSIANCIEHHRQLVDILSVQEVLEMVVGQEALHEFGLRQGDAVVLRKEGVMHLPAPSPPHTAMEMIARDLGLASRRVG